MPHSVICKIGIIPLLTSVVIVVRNEWNHTRKALSTTHGTQEMLMKAIARKKPSLKLRALAWCSPHPLAAGSFSGSPGRCYGFRWMFWDAEFSGMWTVLSSPRVLWAGKLIFPCLDLRNPHACSRHRCVLGVNPGLGTDCAQGRDVSLDGFPPSAVDMNSGPCPPEERGKGGQASAGSESQDMSHVLSERREWGQSGQE